MTSSAASGLAEALAVLEAKAAPVDADAIWPAASWEALRRAGVLGWIVPPAYGGQGLPPVDLLDGYVRIAGACLTTCFLLSQRDAACRRIRDSGQQALCQELLPALARGDRFSTVGLSQLTTSRQHGRPALVGQMRGDTIQLDGVMPWVTGAAHADHFVTGAVLDDGRQLLLVVPRALSGIVVMPALDLAALQGSLTAEVRCDGVLLDKNWVLAGPAEQVMPPSRGAGSLETSALALGLAGSAIAYLTLEGQKRPEWRIPADACAQSHRQLLGRLRQLAAGGGSAEEAAKVRARSNTLVLRASQLALAAGKGSGFVRAHPAQRWARQALFFLVWSCPRPALEATLTHLQPPGDDVTTS
jgi:alkylation response protein AidB-like acyl-CoA dehydrogenase